MSNITHTSLDIVYIANLNHQHTPLTIEALDASKHVLSEKAMACNVNEMKLIIERAKKSDKFVMEAIWTRYVATCFILYMINACRFQPAWQKLKSIVQSNELGKLHVYHANFGVCLVG